MEATTEGTAAGRTVDPAEIARFSAMADSWWDPNGKFKPLHRLNPVRIGYVRDVVCRAYGRDPDDTAALAGLTVVDVGCGGGLISEPVARLGASVTGVDASSKNIAIASVHAEKMGLAIDYQAKTSDDLVAEGRQFDVVLALEIIEHVADVPAFIASLRALAKPGAPVLISTLNRTAKALLLAIIGAEYVLRWLPPGTHSFEKFIRPTELETMLAEAGLRVTDRKGVVYNPLRDDWRLSRDTDVNYMVLAERPAVDA